MTKRELLHDGNIITTYARGNELPLVHVLTLVCGVAIEISEEDYQRLANIPRKATDTKLITETAT